MAAEYSLALARVAAGQLVEQGGFDAVHESAIEVLAGLLLRYEREAAAGSSAYAELACRAEANVADVALALEDLGTTIDDLLQYQQGLIDAAPPDEEPPTFAHPLTPYPVRRELPPIPTFADKGETPPPHIPSYLPAFPDVHTYVQTPKFIGHETDPVQQNKIVQSGRRTAERALLQLHQRLTRTSAEQAARNASSAANGGNGSSGSAALAAGNVFLAQPAFEVQADAAAGMAAGNKAMGSENPSGGEAAPAAGTPTVAGDAPGTRAFEALIGSGNDGSGVCDVAGAGAGGQGEGAGGWAAGGWASDTITWKVASTGTDESGAPRAPLGFSLDWAAATRRKAQAFASLQPNSDAFKDGVDSGAGGGGNGTAGGGFGGGSRGSRKRKSVYASGTEAGRRKAEEILARGSKSMENADAEGE